MSVQEVLPVRIAEWQRNFAANETRTVDRDRLATSLISRVRALVFTDQAGTLYLEETDNRAGAWTTLYTLGVTANFLAEVPWEDLSKRWYRWRYVNGATAQTECIIWEDKAGRPVSDTRVTGVIPLWTVSQDSAANTAMTVTRAAEVSRKHCITMLEVVLSGAAAANDITVLLKEGATVKWKEVIGSGAARGTAVGFTASQGMGFAENTAVTVEVLAGGAGVVTTTNIAGYTA